MDGELIAVRLGLGAPLEGGENGRIKFHHLSWQRPFLWCLSARPEHILSTILPMLEEAGQVDTSYYYYTDVVGDKAIFDLIGIDALVNNGSLILDVYTNFPESGTTVGSAPVFAADLAIDVATGGNPLDSPFEFGVALSETEGLKSCINE